MKKQIAKKIELILYKFEKKCLKFLLLKRSLKDGGFWQPITGSLEEKESNLDCAFRELKEETGIINPSLNFKPIYKFTWEKDGQPIKEFVYAAETHDCQIILSNEHIDYQWSTYEEAIKLLPFKDNREALLKVKVSLLKNV